MSIAYNVGSISHRDISKSTMIIQTGKCTIIKKLYYSLVRNKQVVVPYDKTTRLQIIMSYKDSTELS